LNRKLIFLCGILAVLAVTATWHGPMGHGERFATRVESAAQTTLDHFEMTQVTARIERRPLGRYIRLSGQADDFQRMELIRIIGEVPGVAGVRWAPEGFRMPLLIEAWLASIAAFLLGLLLAYLLELHRRASADRRW